MGLKGEIKNKERFMDEGRSEKSFNFHSSALTYTTLLCDKILERKFNYLKYICVTTHYKVI